MGLFSFPDPVNETSSRIVAGGVVLLCLAAVATRWLPLYVLIAAGFWARTLTGPTLSPLGQLATRVITPRLKINHQYCPGPPKRFAQAIGAVMSTGALVLTATGNPGLACLTLSLLAVFATLEAVLGFCLGCKIFNLLIKAGLVPQSVCERCANLTLESAEAAE